MRIKRSLACFFLCFGFVANALAGWRDLKEPGLGFPDSFPAAVQTQINAVLRRPDCKFLGGLSHNSGTVLRFEGETVPLNLFLESLAACPGITLSMRFNNPENANYDWTVEQGDFDSNGPGGLCVRVNLKSPRIKIENLVVPDIKGPSLPEKNLRRF
jgi:hypothetical protein